MTAIQGPVHLNRCLVPQAVCARRDACQMCGPLHELQDIIDRYMARVTLQELLAGSDVTSGQQ